MASDDAVIYWQKNYHYANITKFIWEMDGDNSNRKFHIVKQNVKRLVLLNIFTSETESQIDYIK